MYTSSVLAANLALLKVTTMASPTNFPADRAVDAHAEFLPLDETANDVDLLFKRQGHRWNEDGDECEAISGNACVARGGDPTVDDRFSDGNMCQSDTKTYTSKAEKTINDQGATANCSITLKTDDHCCVNGKCSAQEISLDRQVAKTTDVWLPETIGDVVFSVGCPKGSYIQSEENLWQGD